jgi:PAS domain S-box-containing protein
MDHSSYLQILDNLIEHAEDGIFVKDLNGRYIIANDATVRFFHFKDKNSLIGKTDRDLLDNDQATYHESFDKIVLGKKVKRIYEYYDTQTGSYYLISKDVTKNKSNDIIGITGFIVDITDYRQEQEKLAREKERSSGLQLSNQLKSKFLSNLSHNLRTPLMGIMGAAFINETDIPPKFHKELELFKYSAELLLNVVNDIIDYAPLIHQKIQIVPKTFYASTFIYFLKEIVAGICREQGTDYEFIIDESQFPRMLIGDYQKLSHVLNKLILISLTDIPHTGYLQIKLELESRSNETAMLTCQIFSSRIISEEVAERLFLFFTDIHERDLLEHESSLGLDMYIAHKIVLAMNGELKFKHVEDGSMFSVQIPFKTIQTEPAKHVQQFKMKIIVAEDNRINQMVLRRMLDKLGCSVFFANNGKICVDEYKRNKDHQVEQPYDLIFMDVQMPVMNGIDATREIRAMEKKYDWDSIRIMAITAFVTEQDRQDCFEAGMDGFLSKPVTPAMLTNSLLEIKMQQHVSV